MAGVLDNAAITRRFEQATERLRALEAQVAILSENAGVPYAVPGADVPPEVVELAVAGKQLEAIKRYRELTNAGFDDARNVVLGI